MVAREETELERMKTCILVFVHGFEVSSQPRYNYAGMCSIWPHLRGTCHIHIAVIAIVTKRSLFEYRPLEAAVQPKTNVIRSA